MPETDIRKFKSLASSRGVSLQEAVHQALERWASVVPKTPAGSLDSLQGSLADIDIELLARQERDIEVTKDRRWS